MFSILKHLFQKREKSIKEHSAQPNPPASPPQRPMTGAPAYVVASLHPGELVIFIVGHGDVSRHVIPAEAVPPDLRMPNSSFLIRWDHEAPYGCVIERETL